MPTPARILVAALLCVVLALLPAAGPTAAVDDRPPPAWVWPLEGFSVSQPYRAPAHDYAAGHRGIDLLPRGGSEPRSPAAGVIAFAGSVAGRPVVTIDHGDGLVTTLEPVTGLLPPGTAVSQGQAVGLLGSGGHVGDAGLLHFGVRRDGRYINPTLLLGGVPRAVLLPCC